MIQGKRFNYEDRKTIEEMLDKGCSLLSISEETGFAATSISREVLRNRIELRPRVIKCKVKPMTCKKFRYCTKKGICSSRCPRRCRSCDWKRCEDICPDFTKITCTATQGFPHTCNSCSIKNRCLDTRYVYRAKQAQGATEMRASEPRKGIDMSEAELMWLSDIISPLIAKKQSVSVILANHPEIAMSAATLYKYIDLGKLKSRNIDLLRAVKMKKRTHIAKDRITKHTEDGRSFDDFCNLHASLKQLAIEMDTVIGKKGGKTLITFCSRKSNIFYAYLMEKNTAQCVIDALDAIERSLVASCVLVELQPILLLTDNGSEFSRSEEIERCADYPDEKRLDLYYCDPYSSWQKPHVENAHTLLRRVLLKGTSFDALTQEKIARVCSHINSYPRKEFGWKSPFMMLPEWGQENLPKALGMEIIDPDDVDLTPGADGK